MKKAIVIGATGMVGTQLIEQLLVTKDYSQIVSFVRRASGAIHPKLIEHVWISINLTHGATSFRRYSVFVYGNNFAQAKQRNAV